MSSFPISPIYQFSLNTGVKKGLVRLVRYNETLSIPSDIDRDRESTIDNDSSSITSNKSNRYKKSSKSSLSLACVSTQGDIYLYTPPSIASYLEEEDIEERDIGDVSGDRRAVSNLEHTKREGRRSGPLFQYSDYDNSRNSTVTTSIENDGNGWMFTHKTQMISNSFKFDF